MGETGVQRRLLQGVAAVGKCPAGNGRSRRAYFMRSGLAPAPVPLKHDRAFALGQAAGAARGPEWGGISTNRPPCPPGHTFGAATANARPSP